MKKFLKFLGLWLFIPSLVLAQTAKLTDPIPTDPSVKIGKLANGLTYYIKKNSKPENKVDLRLVINAGSILETDQQQGLAHFMEHMCFNGTKRFPKNALVDYLQSIGVKFGQHLNAYTSFDETVYFLPIPSDDAEKLEKGFQILEDWGFNAVLTPEEVDKERGVVLEEYRIGLGADKRMMGRFMPKLMYQSHYADRMPIGKKEILENFTHDKLSSFYKDWYRPNLMSVIVVGDINVAEMEQKIKNHFGTYKNPKAEKSRKLFDVPNHKETFVAVESDPEASFANVQLVYKDYKDPKIYKTIGDYRAFLLSQLFGEMLNNRLEEIRNSNNPPFTYGYTYHGSTWARTKAGYQSFAMTPEDKQLDALKVLVTENERVKLYGFTQTELDRAKTSFLALFESRYNEKDKQESENYVWEYQSNFLEQTPIPGVEWEYATIKQLFPAITIKEVNGLISDYIKDDNRVVVLTGPEKEGLKKPTEEEVLNTLKVDGNTIKPYQDTAVAESLLRNKVNGGTVTQKETNNELWTTTITLSNGIKVIYKKTDFKNDEILFQANGFGGTNLISNEELPKIQWAISGLSEAGFSGMKKNDITKFMQGKIAEVRPYIYGYTEGLNGSSTPKDFEYLLQMVYAYFTDLNFDNEAFESYKTKQKGIYSNLLSQPNFYFMNELQAFINTGNPRFSGIFPNDSGWEKTDYSLAYQKYKERFANAADFVFYFVGNIDESTFEKNVAFYLGALPTNQTFDKIVDLGYRNIKGEHKKIINKGKDPKSNVRIIFSGEAIYDGNEAIALKALSEVLDIKLIEELRENESGVYGISSNGSMNKLPYGSYNFSISFPCGPENAEKLTESALREVQKIIENGPVEKDIIKFKEAEALEYKKSTKENQYWLNAFVKAQNNQTNLTEIVDYIKKIETITAKDIQNVAKKYLNTNKIIAIQMPEK